MPARTAAQRFWAKVAVAGGDACWEWLGAKTYNGYGRFYDEHGRVVQAHRWVYGYVVAEVPDELVVDHLCRNVGCIGLGRPRAETCRKGHALTRDNVDVRPDGGRRCITCRRARENARHRRGVAA